MIDWMDVGVRFVTNQASEVSARAWAKQWHDYAERRAFPCVCGNELHAWSWWQAQVNLAEDWPTAVAVRDHVQDPECPAQVAEYVDMNTLFYYQPKWAEDRWNEAWIAHLAKWAGEESVAAYKREKGLVKEVEIGL